MILTTPYSLDLRPYSDALGLSIVQLANRDLAFDDRDVTWLLVVALIVSVALLLAPRFVGRRPAGIVVGAAAGLVLAWNLAGQISASNAVNSASQELKANFPQPATWLDHADHGGKPRLHRPADPDQPERDLADGVLEPLAPERLEPRRDGPPGPGLLPHPGRRPRRPADLGRAYPRGAPPGVEYVVADKGIDVVGTQAVQPTIRHVLTEDQFGFPIHKVVVEKAAWRVLRITQPLRLSHDVEGIEPDGWSTPPPGAGPGAPAFTAYNQFATPGGKPGWVRVVVSRAGWRGRDRPGNVTIKVGRLIRGADKQPALGKVSQVLHWRVKAGKERVFTLPISPPGRVQVTVSPTFSPHDFGRSDRRRLGAQVAFSFSETPPPGR